MSTPSCHRPLRAGPGPAHVGKRAPSIKPVESCQDEARILVHQFSGNVAIRVVVVRLCGPCGTDRGRSPPGRGPDEHLAMGQVDHPGPVSSCVPEAHLPTPRKGIGVPHRREGDGQGRKRSCTQDRRRLETSPRKRDLTILASAPSSPSTNSISFVLTIRVDRVGRDRNTALLADSLHSRLGGMLNHYSREAA